MARIKISELLKNGATFLGQKIEVKGWVRAFRSKRFVQLNDGSCMANIQGVIDYDNFDEEQLKAISTGAAISIKGLLVESQGAGQVVELQVEAFEIIGAADPDAVQKTILQPKKHSLDLLREQAHLRFRTNTFGAIFRIRHAASFAIHQFFNERGFNYIHTPILTGSDAEGAGEMFRVSTLDPKNPPLDEDGILITEKISLENK
jgi:asparaginyl-tRNA synthetase